MLYIKDGYPEVNEIVKCTVTKVYGNTVFLTLDEYEKEGVLTISEIAPGRIRNLREYVVENKTIICKVLRVDETNKRIDVSLRRVPITVMKEKLEEIKKEEFADKVYFDVSEKLQITKDELFEKTYEPIFEEFETVYEALEKIMNDNSKISIFTGLDDKQRQIFLDTINEKIKPEIFTIKKQFYLSSLDSEGVEKIKSSIENILEKINFENIKVIYLAAGKFEVIVSDELKKEAEKISNTFLKEIEEISKKEKLNYRI